VRNFEKIQNILGTLPDLKKIYLIGCTGAGKTSLVQHILGSKKSGFPVTTHRRTTIAPTEYLIKKNIPFKTTIILKKKEDVVLSIEELLQNAILKAKEDASNLDDVIFELEQSPDERFKLNQMVSPEVIREISNNIIEFIPKIKDKELNDETLLSSEEIAIGIDELVKKILKEIETNFNNACDNENELFSSELIVIEHISDKEEFIKATKKYLSHEFGSISILAEYVRIEGDLLADWLDLDFDFLLIDGEGIGHSLNEKKDILSARHYNFFNFCNHIVLMDDATNPFASGGQGAIEGIFLNGYQSKFKLCFSKADKLEQKDPNVYFRRNINNLKNALKNEDIEFKIENKDTFKLKDLDKIKIDKSTKKEINKLLNSFKNETLTDAKLIPLEYDFNLLFSNYDNETLVTELKKQINTKHWAVIKAFSKRLYNNDIEYKDLKPLSWILTFLMKDINLFLKRDDDLNSDVCDRQNMIKQNISKKIIDYFFSELIKSKNHLWQQAFEKNGRGSHHERKEFIFKQILSNVLPLKNSESEFVKFKEQIKKLLIESDAKEIKSPVKTVITHVSIKKIFREEDNNIEWSLNNDTNILIGKNGSGKSTILKLINACINNDDETLDSFGFPYVELTVNKYYDNGEIQESIINNSRSMTNIKVAVVDTFDVITTSDNSQLSNLNGKLMHLIHEFGEYQRNLIQLIKKKTIDQSKKRNEMLINISSLVPEELVQFQELSIEINNLAEKTNEPLHNFKTLIEGYFKETGKQLIIDDEKSPLLVTLKNEPIELTKLSSGEKQLLIIFLTVILHKNMPFILLMDEPETSLHVEWQSTFIDRIKELNSGVQIIIATHNPLILLNRESDEIGIIEPSNSVVQKRAVGTKYLDISSILLSHFNLSSLIGIKMQGDIKRFTELKLKEDSLSPEEIAEFSKIRAVLDNSLAGDIIYNEKYFRFLKFLKENKNISFEEYEKATEEEMEGFLSEFGAFFND